MNKSSSRKSIIKKSLWSLRKGEVAIINKLNANGDIRRRLQDLGFIEGNKAVCVLKSPFGEPVAFFVKGAIIALRKEELENILIA
ncbi:MAG: FeoA family protein [Oscillospiraceae bacterium]